MEYFGYAGKVLRVDLSKKSIKKEDLDLELAKKYLGGMGLAVKEAYDLIKPGIDPLGPENALIIAAGALQGTLAPSASQTMMTTKFPVNGAVGTSTVCSFGPMLKWAGYDQVVITGASDKPVYLQIFDDEVKIVDASHLWGRDVFDATNALRDQLGNDISVFCIGQAGENLVKISLGFVDNVAHAGRGGLAAVMGSKKLKAVVVRGTKGIRIADVEASQKMCDAMVGRAMSDRNRDKWIKYGIEAVADAWAGAGVMLLDNKHVRPPIDQTIARYGLRAFDAVCDTFPWGGQGCVTSDKAVMKVKTGQFKDLVTTGSCPSAAVLFAIPAEIPMDEGFKLVDMLQRYGIDMLDFGYAIDLLISLYKEGKITAKDVGMELKADYKTIAKAIEDTAFRRGFWAIVADGFPRIMKEIKGAEKAVAPKGLASAFDARVCLGVESFDELTQQRGANAGSGLVRTPATAIPGVPMAGIKTLAAAYQISEAARKRIFTDDDWNVARMTAWVQNVNTAYNCTGVCTRFLIGRIWNPVAVAGFYKASTGIDITPQEVTRAGERVWNLQKAANVREGFTRKDDEWPERWLNEPIKYEKGDMWLQNYNKTKRITKVEAEQLLDDYYDERGWDIKAGIPTKDKLVSLGLADVAQDLEKRGLLPK